MLIIQFKFQPSNLEKPYSLTHLLVSNQPCTLLFLLWPIFPLMTFHDFLPSDNKGDAIIMYRWSCILLHVLISDGKSIFWQIWKRKKWVLVREWGYHKIACIVQALVLSVVFLYVLLLCLSFLVSFGLTNKCTF